MTGWRLAPGDDEDWTAARRPAPGDCAASAVPAGVAPPVRVTDVALSDEWATWTLSDGTLLSRPLPRPVS